MRYLFPRTAALIAVVVTFSAQAEARYRFQQCKARVQGIMDGTLDDPYISKQTLRDRYLYQGHVRGMDYGLFNKSPPEQTYYKITYEGKPIPMLYFYCRVSGCTALCGNSSTGLNDVYTAFAILTTWVLPAIALFSNLPYDSPAEKKKRKIFEAFTNWIGSPQSSLATTMFNVHIIRECRSRAGSGNKKPQIYKDAYYILSCINQYEYPSYRRKNVGEHRDPPWSLEQQKALQLARDEVVLYGLFRPLTRHISGKDLDEGDIKDTRVLLSNLAHQLRMLRRRGVYPQSINVLWFLVAFVISLVTAFADLGDNTTAHSLSLGLLLSWLPVLITMVIVDRNPSASTRCRVLIERWMYNVNYVLRTRRHPSIDRDDKDKVIHPTTWWNTSADPDLLIGEFVGQGRRLRYCGIANAMLTVTKPWKHTPLPADPFPDSSVIESNYTHAVSEFRKVLVKRPLSWWIIWLAAEYMVSISAWMAFTVSFNTPTVGLGCRSFVCLLWWILSSVSWVLQAVEQEPPPWTRRISIPVNTASTFLLILIMILQVTNGMNNCYCKAVLMGAKGWGGYTDLENAKFYKMYFHVVTFWAPAAAMGLTSTLLFIFWGLRKWAKSADLWKTDEDGEFPEQDERADPVDLKWLI